LGNKKNLKIKKQQKTSNHKKIATLNNVTSVTSVTNVTLDPMRRGMPGTSLRTRRVGDRRSGAGRVAPGWKCRMSADFHLRFGKLELRFAAHH